MSKKDETEDEGKLGFPETGSGDDTGGGCLCHRHGSTFICGRRSTLGLDLSELRSCISCSRRTRSSRGWWPT
jgi:hypothetical protein